MRPYLQATLLTALIVVLGLGLSGGFMLLAYFYPLYTIIGLDVIVLGGGIAGLWSMIYEAVK